jgi:reticulon-4-interacting protein 1, mitochondrial
MVNMIPSPTQPRSLLTHQQPQLLQPKGAYVTIVGDKTGVKTLGGPFTYFTCPSQILRYLKGYFFGPRYACVSLLTKSSYLDQVVSLAERGEVKTEVQEVIEGEFDEREGWRRAVECMEGGCVRGKVVLAIS